MKSLGVGGAFAAVLVSSAASAAVTKTILAYRKIECVLYVREIVKSLPYGLTTWESKKRIINSYACKAGSVAIIRVPTGWAAQYGHVAYVERCDKTGITIRESNFGGDWIQRRVATPNIAQAESDLRIVGYWNPK